MKEFRPPSYSKLGGDRSGGASRWKRISRWARHRKFSLLLVGGVIAVVIYILFYGIPRKVRLLEGEPAERKGITIKGSKFLLNGTPFRFLSGSIHYFRVPRAYWRDRLAKLKAVGLNTLDTYVAWNMHEERRGHFDFSGNLDIVEFLSIAHELGLYVILRPGPYICAEWDWGGLPAWLLADPEMKVRSIKESFSTSFEQFFAELFRRVAPLQYTKGGPIIAVQIENEYGSYYDDKNILLYSKEMMSKLGVVEFFFTSDGPDALERGYTPGVYATVNANHDIDAALDALAKFQPGAPLMMGEFWPGWFDHWSEKHHVMPADDMVRRLEPIFKRGASVNLYMFHGGTNFGFMNGANILFPDEKEGMLRRLWDRLSDVWSSDHSRQYPLYRPTITSYDYDAPLNEFGGKTEKYEQLRQLILRYQTREEKKAKPSVDPWTNSRSPTSYGQFNIHGSLPLTDALEILQPLPIDLQRPTFVEQLSSDTAHRLYYGFVVYRTRIARENVKKITVSGVVADRMLVVMNGKTIATIQSNLSYAPVHREIDVSSALRTDDRMVGQDGEKRAAKGHDLILLVENTGRANYVKMPHKLDKMYKGFNGSVTLGDPDAEIVLDDWKIYGIRFKTPSELAELVSSARAESRWKPMAESTAIDQPAFYRADFDAGSTNAEYPDDTFVLTKNWGKGVIYANGVNLGRYWNVGPQQTLYLPGAWLKKAAKNELIVFELYKPASTITLQAEPELGTPCPLPCYS